MFAHAFARRLVQQQSRVLGRRNFGGPSKGPEADAQGVSHYWTYAMIFTPTAVGIGSLILATKHPHDEAEHDHFPYLHIRGKAYPWSSGDCNVFDLKCRKDAKEGVASHH